MTGELRLERSCQIEFLLTFHRFAILSGNLPSVLEVAETSAIFKKWHEDAVEGLFPPSFAGKREEDCLIAKMAQFKLGNDPYARRPLTSASLLANVLRAKPEARLRRAELERAVVRWRASGGMGDTVSMALVTLVGVLTPSPVNGSAAGAAERAQLTYARALHRRGQAGGLGAAAAVLAAARAAREARQDGEVLLPARVQ